MVVGELLIEMRADLARLTSDLGAGKAAVGNFAQQVSQYVATAQKALAGLGIVGVGDFLATLAKDTIEAQAHLDDLSKSTGIAVEQLAGLKLAAAVSGTNLDTAAGSANRLAANIGKNAQAFQLLGVSSNDPLKALEQLSDVLSSIQEPTLRAAVASQALGKGWQAIAPLLAEGGAHIQELVDEGTRLSNVTAESAKAANELNKHWEELVGTGGLLNSVVNRLVPELDSLTTSAIKFRDAKLGDEWSMFIAAAARSANPFTGAAQAISLFTSNVKQASQVSKEFAQWADAGDSVSRRLASDTAAAARAFLGQGAATQTVVHASNDLDEVLEKIFAKESGFSPDFTKNMALVTEGFATGRLTAGQYGAAVQALIAQQPVYLANLKAESAAEVEYVKQLRAAQEEEVNEINTRNAILDGLVDQEAAMKAQLATLGMTDAERLIYLDSLKMEKELKVALADPNLSPEEVTKITNEITARHANIQAMTGEYAQLQNQLSIWGELGDKTGTFFADLAQHGSRAFQDLRQMANQFLADMVKLFAQRWILQLGATATGSSALGAQANSLGANTLEGAAGTALNQWAGGLIDSSTLTGGISSAVFGTASLTGAGDFVGTGLAGMAGNLALAGGATDAFAATLAAAVPVIGWIVAIGAVLWAIFGSSGGPAKQQGAFAGSFNSSGNMLSSLPGAEDLVDIHGTQDANNAQAQAIGQAAATGVVQSLTAFGGSPSAFQLGVGFSQNPGGSAPGFFHGELSDSSGNQFFKYNNDNLSTDPATFATQVQSALARFVVAAVQHDPTIPKAIQAIVSTVDAASATDAQIASILQLAQAFKTLKDNLGPINAQDIIKAASQSSFDALTAQGTALQQFAASASLTTDNLQALTQSTVDFKNAAATLIVQMEQAKLSIHDLFAGTARTITLGGLDTQGQYDYYQAEAARLQQQALGSNDAATVQRLAQQIDQDMEAAFNLLSPDQQNAMRPQFLQGVNSTDTALEAHLTVLEGTVETMANQITSAIGTAMDAAAEKLGAVADAQGDAAKIQKQAADENLAAARTPEVVVLQYPDGTQLSTFRG